MKTKSIELNERFDHVYWSFYLYNTSLTELLLLTQSAYSPKECNIIKGRPFNFYKVTLQYCFLMEYNKLLEKGGKQKEHNVSSLFHLNKYMLDFIGDKYDESYLQNKVDLETILNTDTYYKFRDLRDSKFAHSDFKSSPFQVKALNEDEIDEAFEHLNVIREVIKRCTKQFDFIYDLAIPSRDKRTFNFVSNQSKYKEYYLNSFGKDKKTKM